MPNASLQVAKSCPLSIHANAHMPNPLGGASKYTIIETVMPKKNPMAPLSIG